MSIPNIYENQNGDRLMWDVYSRQLKDRIVWLGTDVNSYIANAIVAQLLYLDTSNPGKDIYLYINSPGGSITAGMAIYDTMNYISSDVVTICVGQAASMGAFLLSAGAPGKRHALPNSEIMIHQPLGGFSGQASDIAIHANRISQMKKKLNALMAEQTGQPLERIEQDTNRDNFMTAEEAKAYGLVDSVIGKRDLSLYEEGEK